MHPLTAQVTFYTVSKLYSVNACWPHGYRWKGGFTNQIAAEQWAQAIADTLGRKCEVHHATH